MLTKDSVRLAYAQDQVSNADKVSFGVSLRKTDMDKSTFN